MIEVACGCATPKSVAEAYTGKRFRCATCRQTIHLTAGEALPQGSGAGDFDAGLTITEGPDSVGLRFLIGGVADIEIGKVAESQIMLPGSNVSRAYCKLARLDFGPSRWNLIDNSSTNGIFVNGDRVFAHELRDGDIVTIGDYDLRFGYHVPNQFAPSPQQMTGASATDPSQLVTYSGGGPNCPSCDKSLVKNAKVCVDCGIDIVTGRPFLVSQGVDENSLYEGARQWIRWVSFLVPVTPMPIPIRSEGFGTGKPYAIWTIAAVTILVSIIFFVAQNSGPVGSFERPGNSLMLWAPGGLKVRRIDPAKIHALAKRLTDEDRDSLRDKVNDPLGHLSDDELLTKAAMAYLGDASVQAHFHPYQLITHAFLHDTSSIYNFIMHLAGNMLFLLVFGTRVNALIGNIATAILYPILAVCAAAAQLLSIGNRPAGPMLGASGAIMGLAGMYLILFPVHRVFCAMWIRLWFLRIRRLFACKIFQVRGFWILLIYFAYDVIMNAITAHLGVSGGVAHWAHIGGFLTGATLALAILFSRQFNTHGGDVLSVTLGKHAWPLIGKPSRWIQEAQILPRARSLNYA